MKLVSDSEHFGLINILFHWTIAILTLSVFFIGIWMVELDYYDEWFQLGPWWHEGLGVLVMLFVTCRWLWQLVNIKPLALTSIPRWQQRISHIVHLLMSIITLAIGVSGYLIVTAKGQALMVFSLLKVPAIITGIANMEDIAGEIHFLLAYLLMALVVMHVLAALKHHIVNKDKTLLRMLGR